MTRLRMRKMKNVLAEDINKLIDLADIVDAGSCPEDSQFCDMYTRYDKYGASMLRMARTLNLVSAEYCDTEPLKFIFDLGQDINPAANAAGFFCFF